MAMNGGYEGDAEKEGMGKAKPLKKKKKKVNLFRK